MDISIVKFFILWIICENFMLTSSMVLKGKANEENNTRQKRSPANNFSLFGFNPISTAKESFSTIGNIFSGNQGNQYHNIHQEPIEVNNPYDDGRNTNTFSPDDFPRRNGIPKSMTKNENQNRYDWPQENKNEFDKKTEPDKKQKLPTKTVPEKNNEVLANTSDVPSNVEVDKQLLDYIFQKSQFNYDAAGTTVDNNIEFVTETGEFETTTDTLNNRVLPAAAVASLLG